VITRYTLRELLYELTAEQDDQPGRSHG
jgi:hypothetical protein